MIKYNHFEFTVRVKPSPFSDEFKDIKLNVRSDKYLTARHLLHKYFDVLNSICVQEFQVFDKYELKSEQTKLSF